MLDVGKTNAKVAFMDPRTGSEVWSSKRANQVVASESMRQLDVVEIERWLLRSLQQAPHRERVSVIVPIAHGAAAVFIDNAGNVVAAPDYEDPIFEAVRDEYERERDAFAETFSPSLPLGLNLGRQLYFLGQRRNEQFAKSTHALLYPQYWAWRLSGVMASEVTSLGCHTDLWYPRRRTFSELVRRRDWSRLFPKVRFAGEPLGLVTPEVAQASGLRRDCRVVCGIHDSNASYLEHLLARPRGTPFTVISSGTWTVIMANAADPSRLRAERDMLANVDARGEIVSTARFMGGREYELIAGPDAVPDEEAINNVLHRHVMAVPAFARGGPFMGHPGKVLHAGNLSATERAAVATLYTVLMSELLLDNLGASGDVVVDGPLAQNRFFGPLLAALRPSSRVLPAASASWGARAMCHLAGLKAPASKENTSQFEPLRATGLHAYRAAWREVLPNGQSGASL
jgi:L-fuculokinase